MWSEFAGLRVFSSMQVRFEQPGVLCWSERKVFELTQVQGKVTARIL